jgi:hypothetical protein
MNKKKNHNNKLKIKKVIVVLCKGLADAKVSTYENLNKVSNKKTVFCVY